MEMRPYLIFASVGLSLLMLSIDSTVVAVAMPSLIKDLHTNVLWAAWTISIYLVAVTSSLPLVGSLGDILGRKRLYLISLILFTGSSCVCGLATNIYGLIVFRFLQGLGGATFLPTAAAIVSEQFPENRERVIGLFTSIFPIGGIVGPNLGGWIVSRYSWRYIFYINLPIGLLLILLISILLHDSRHRDGSHIDYAGAIFFFGTILFLMLGLNFLAESFSVSSFLLSVVFFMTSCSFVLAFVRQERKTSTPIFDVALLRSRPFLAANLYNFATGAGIFAVYSIIPLYATSVYRLSTLVSGMILTPGSIGMIFMAAITSFLLKRWGYRWAMVYGMIVASLSTILFSGDFSYFLESYGISVTETMVFLIAIRGIGIGMILPASNNACIELMPDKVATIVGLRGMFRTVGGVIGISVITIILHLNATPAIGFKIIFLIFGFGLLFSIPLAFFMPSGKKIIAKV